MGSFGIVQSPHVLQPILRAPAVQIQATALEDVSNGGWSIGLHLTQCSREVGDEARPGLGPIGQLGSFLALDIFPKV